MSSGRDSVGRGQHSSNWVSGISTRTMNQSTTPSFSQTVWPRWASRQFPQPPYSPDLAPCDFCSFPKLKEKLRGCRYETTVEIKEAMTKVIFFFYPEDLPKAMNDREEWRERVRDIRATSAIWRWWWRRSLTRSHKRTSIGPSRSCWNGTTSALQPEEITSKRTRVSCVYYQ